MTTTTTKKRRCDGSGVRVPLSAREERARETHCPHCDREVKVRPAREGGNPVATIPLHAPEEKPIRGGGGALFERKLDPKKVRQVIIDLMMFSYVNGFRTGTGTGRLPDEARRAGWREVAEHDADKWLKHLV